MDDMKRMKEFHFEKFHLFINGDFGYYRNNTELLLNTKDNHYIHKDHRVHIFISYDYSAIDDRSLAWFVNFCKRHTLKKVIIHVPKCNKNLVKKVKKALKYCKNCKLINDRGKEIWFSYCIHEKTIINGMIAFIMTDIGIKYNESAESYSYDFQN